MHKIYCSITTPKIKKMAEFLGISESYATNLVSTWQSVNNKPGAEPSI